MDKTQKLLVIEAVFLMSALIFGYAAAHYNSLVIEQYELQSNQQLEVIKAHNEFLTQNELMGRPIQSTGEIEIKGDEYVMKEFMVFMPELLQPKFKKIMEETEKLTDADYQVKIEEHRSHYTTCFHLTILSLIFTAVAYLAVVYRGIQEK